MNTLPNFNEGLSFILAERAIWREPECLRRR